MPYFRAVVRYLTPPPHQQGAPPITMLAALVVCAALALAPTPDRAAGEVASAGPVASSDPLSMLQQNLADLEERPLQKQRNSQNERYSV